MGTLRNASEYDDISFKLLAAEVVVNAVTDWRKLVKRRAWRESPQKNCNFKELRQFFKSSWCALLLTAFEVEPERIHEMLEAELQDAMQRDEN